MHLVIKTKSHFLGPPCNPGKSDFPIPVLALAVSPRDLSETGAAQALARIRPNPFRFTSRLVLKLWLLRLTSLTILGPPSTQSSFACHQRCSWQGGVQRHLEGHCPFFIAHTSSCAKPAPSSGFVYPHLFPAVLAGRCEPLLGTRFFPTLSPQFFPQMPGPQPRRSHRVHLPVSSSASSAFLRPLSSRLPVSSANAIFHGEVSRLSSDSSFVQASEFACLPDRSHRCRLHRVAESFTSRQNVLRCLHTHWICYPPVTGN